MFASQLWMRSSKACCDATTMFAVAKDLVSRLRYILHHADDPTPGLSPCMAGAAGGRGDPQGPWQGLPATRAGDDGATRLTSNSGAQKNAMAHHPTLQEKQGDGSAEEGPPAACGVARWRNQTRWSVSLPQSYREAGNGILASGSHDVTDGKSVH